MTPGAVARMIAREGQGLVLKRLTAAPAVTVDVALRGVIRMAQNEELAGGNPQVRREVRVAHQDVSASDWPAPPRKGDRIADDNGRTYVVQDVDQLYVHGLPAMYVLRVSG